MHSSHYLIISTILIPVCLSCPQLVANHCKCEDLHNGVILDCSHSNGAEVIKVLKENQALLGLVQSLTMHKANIRHIPPSFFSGLYIKKLDLSYNDIVSIDDHAFTGMSRVLQELILTHNNISRVPVGALEALSIILKLDLSNNSIVDIGENDTFPSLPKLFDVNLSANKIRSVHPSTFKNVKNSMQIINLGHNCLDAVPSSSIRGLKQLQALHMQKNNISALEALSFLNLPVLNLLNLAGNKISDVNRQAFLNVPQLRYLYLTDNRITKLTAHQFSSFEQMEMLDLTGNHITELASESLSQLPQLKQLFLGGNRIERIGKNAFANSSIVILSLSDNQLVEITEGILDGLHNLQSVVFKNNQVRLILNLLTMKFYSFNSHKNIIVNYELFNKTIPFYMKQHTLNILNAENPLVCTEKVHMLQDGVGVYIPTSEDIVCGGKPKTTTTTPAPVMLPKLSLHKTNIFDNQEKKELHEMGPVSGHNKLEEVIPIRPASKLDVAGSSSSNIKEITRIRGPHGSDISHTNVPSDIDDDLKKQLEGLDISEIPNSSHEIIPLIDDVEDRKVLIEQHNSLKTTTLGPRVYTDIADNPKVILPFPVPFLKKGPAIHQATRIKVSSETSEISSPLATLPPSIIIEPGLRTSNVSMQRSTDDSSRFEQFALHSKPPAIRTEEDLSKSSTHTAWPTVIIVSCLCLVAVVMAAVFIGLCITRQRGRFNSSYSDSSAARTNAYVSAQTAQMNMIYGTMNRSSLTDYIYSTYL
uniref:Leucine-rich repeat-containing protein let-4 n=1 Tax=Heterorhabditis bacteriophora TaxID=37862 RepID=A0A1I7WD28_HETBA